MGTTNRVVEVVAALALFGACSGDGCSCMTDIPGGFPPGERVDNAVQLRVSESGLTFLENNASGLAADALGGEVINFAVPPSCGGDPRVCCGYPLGYCSLDFDLERLQGDLPRFELTPLGGNRV